jgi:hypothetical protein
MTYVLQEDLKDTTSLLVDQAGDTLHTATTSETTDSLQVPRRQPCSILRRTLGIH